MTTVNSTSSCPRRKIESLLREIKRDSETRSHIPTSLDGILERYCHQSILKIEEVFNTPVKFSFHEVPEDEVQK